MAWAFPFLGDTLAWAGLRGGKALGVTKPAFPPRAPPFRARRCSALWYAVVYWQMPVCCCIGHVHLCRWCAPDGRRSAQQTCSWWLSYCWRDLLLPVVVFLALTCFCLSLYFWRSPVSACCCISGAHLLLPVVVLLALTCFCLLLYFWRSPTSACRCISGAHLLLPAVVLLALTCFCLLLYCRH